MDVTLQLASAQACLVVFRWVGGCEWQDFLLPENGAPEVEGP